MFRGPWVLPIISQFYNLDRFDIILDHKFKPWLLEINHTPSFRTDTPLDKKIKKGLIKDSLRIMNITTKWKKKILKRELAKK